MFSLKELLIYYLIINLFGFFIVIIDKQKAIKHKYRISEKFIFMVALAGGSIGIYFAMFLVRHKTKHKIFTIGIPIIFITNVISIYLLLTNKIVIL